MEPKDPNGGAQNQTKQSATVGQVWTVFGGSVLWIKGKESGVG